MIVNEVGCLGDPLLYTTAAMYIYIYVYDFRVGQRQEECILITHARMAVPQRLRELQ